MDTEALPSHWVVMADQSQNGAKHLAVAEAIDKFSHLAAVRLGGPATHAMLHPEALAILAALANPVMDLTIEQNGDGNNKRTTWGRRGGLTVLSIERHYQRGWSSQAQKWNVWFGRRDAALSTERTGI